MIKWIFFDVGSTLVDETDAYDHRVRDMVAGTGITFEEFDTMRIALARQGLDGHSAAIEYFGLEKTPWHSEDEIPFSDAKSTLETLCRKGYRLGISSLPQVSALSSAFPPIPSPNRILHTIRSNTDTLTHLSSHPIISIPKLSIKEQMARISTKHTGSLENLKRSLILNGPQSLYHTSLT